MDRGSALLLPSSPALSSVQVLSCTNFAPVGFVFPTDGHSTEAVRMNLQYAWKEVRRWHRSFSILCDQAEDEDILHIFHLLFSSLLIVLDDRSSDTIDRNIRQALQPLREWAGTVIRTKEEYQDFMPNVRVSMLCLYQVIQDIGVSQLSSTRQIAEVITSIDEVAIFLKLSTIEPEIANGQDGGRPDYQTAPVEPRAKKTFMTRLLRRLRRTVA